MKKTILKKLTNVKQNNEYVDRTTPVYVLLVTSRTKVT